MTASNLAICSSRGSKIPENRSTTYCMPAFCTRLRSFGAVNPSAAQIDDGLDTHFGEGGEAFGGGLAAAVDVRIHLMEILQTWFARETGMTKR